MPLNQITWNFNKNPPTPYPWIMLLLFPAFSLFTTVMKYYENKEMITEAIKPAFPTSVLSVTAVSKWNLISAYNPISKIREHTNWFCMIKDKLVRHKTPSENWSGCTKIDTPVFFILNPKFWENLVLKWNIKQINCLA